jgi:uncharacterized protein GlcG (DUF336 family)
MSNLTLAEADAIADGVLDSAATRGLNPIAVVVLDPAGNAVVVKRQDAATFLRVDVATAKAWTAVALQSPSRNFATTGESRPLFATAVMTISQGRMLPGPGGVTILRDGEVIGAVGVSGDTPDNDEAAATDGIVAGGLQAGT